MKHQFAPNSRVVDALGNPLECVVCGFPKANWRHRNAPADVVTDRIMGEAETVEA